MRSPCLFTSLFCLILIVSAPWATAADPYILPPGSGAKNVRDFGAKGDGRADDTAAILKALVTDPERTAKCAETWKIWNDDINHSVSDYQ